MGLPMHEPPGQAVGISTSMAGKALGGGHTCHKSEKKRQISAHPVGMQLGCMMVPATVSYRKGSFVLCQPRRMYRPKCPKKKPKEHDLYARLLGHPIAQKAPPWAPCCKQTSPKLAGYDAAQAKGIKWGMED